MKITQYRDFLTANGHVEVSRPEQGDVSLLWSCGFRSDYRDNSLSVAEKYGQEYGTEVVLLGCLPDIDPDYVKSRFSGRVVNWRDDAEKLEEMFGGGGKKLSDIPLGLAEEKLCDSAAEYRKQNPGRDASFSDESVKLYVSEGCTLECTYCSERLMFPPYRSFPEGDLVEAARQCVDRGQYEVMLHADSVGDYGCDTGTDLPSLIEKLCAIHPKVRIGIQGYNPAHFIRFYDSMVEYAAAGRIFHFRLPMQSASPRILRLMRRTYSVEQVVKIFGYFSSTDFREFSTDMIVGFPGEEEEDFRVTIDFLLKYKPKYLLLSSYMDSPELPSFQLPDKVDGDVKKRRIEEADSILGKAGIICNTDGGTLSDHRRCLINRIE